MNAELTPEPMMTERNCMKVVGRLSEPSLLMPSGKRSTKSGPRGHQRSFLSGSVRGQTRKLEMLRPQRMSMMRKRRRRRKRRRKKKSKHYSQKTSDLSTNCASLSICSKPHEICSTFLTELKLPTHCCDKTDFWYRSN